MTCAFAAAFLATTSLMMTSVSAQEQPTGGARPQPPRWDVVATVGYFVTPSDTEDSTSPRLGLSRLEFQVSVERYWTTHLRTDIGFSTATRDDRYAWEDLPGFGFVAVDRLVRLYAIPAAVSYRPFEENIFVHPYLSGGVRVGVLSEHRSSYQSFEGLRLDRPISTLHTSVLALPFVAAGLTTSGRGRILWRSEVLVAFESGGVAHVTLRAGVGVHF